jgi:hypothetical protein
MTATATDRDVEMIPPATVEQGVFVGVRMHVRGSFHSKITIKHAEDMLRKQGGQMEDRVRKEVATALADCHSGSVVLLVFPSSF